MDFLRYISKELQLPRRQLRASRQIGRRHIPVRAGTHHNLARNLYASLVGRGNTKANSVQFGISKAINFGSEENF
ncbi:hypothetical protein LEP1GSC061_1054 [Leptospira wolffii serovar Khorat str. Khorat-H2]|nr:hypothetical protein LEP1GSC061_1054 [Leptospira wolffii serovar Khorat str. Khorat-H2]